MKYAQIVDGKVHLIFDDEMTLVELYEQKFNKDDIQLVDITGKSNVECWDDYVDGQFVKPTAQETIDELKGKKWVSIKKARDAAEREPLPYMGALFDFDDTSSERLNWALEAARSAQALGATFSVNWTTADNATITMTDGDIIGLPIAVAQRSDALHQKARALRAAIDAATTAEEVTAVSW